MASIPVNRGAMPLGVKAPAPLPARVQNDNFGSRQAAPAGGTLSTGRVAQPRPTITTAGPAQGKESFVASDVGLSVARALNSLQTKIETSTGEARANPLGRGHLFQNVPLFGTRTTGPSSSAPAATGLPSGFMYFDTTLGKPLWLHGANWVDATGTVAYAATSGPLSVTTIDHGFGSPATGAFITNVVNAVLQTPPALIFTGNPSIDSVSAGLWVAYISASAATPTADIYVFQ